MALLELLPLVGLLVGLLELFVSPLPKGIGKKPPFPNPPPLELLLLKLSYPPVLLLIEP